MHFLHNILFLLFLRIVYASNSKREYVADFTKPLKRRSTELQHIMDFKIVGGMEASVKDFPFMVSVQMMSTHICGGTIITETFVLTAAHCLTVLEQPLKTNWSIIDPLYLNIVAGQTILDMGDCQYRDTKTFHVHSQYNDSVMVNDIALIEIFEPFEWNDYTAMTKLFSNVHPAFESYDFCTVTGWGTLEAIELGEKSVMPNHNILQQVDLQPSSRNICERYFSMTPQYFDDTKLCIIVNEGKDACLGDSGGPIICNGIQYGIISFGLGCAQTNMPGAFTNVSAMYEWIYGIINATEMRVVSRSVNMVNVSRILSPRTRKIPKNNTKNVQTKNNANVSLVLATFLYIAQMYYLYNS